MSIEVCEKRFLDVYQTTLTTIIQHSDKTKVVECCHHYLKRLTNHKELEPLFSEIDIFLSSIATDLSDDLWSDVNERELLSVV